MPAPKVPGSVAYPSILIGAAGEAAYCLPDAPRSLPFFLDWGAVGSNISSETPAFHLTWNSSTANLLKQIAGVFVDNSRSHQGVYLLFPDTNFRLTIPPFKRGYYQVLTAGTDFYAGIFDPAHDTNDHTIIHVLNWQPQPFEGDALIQPQSWQTTFDPASSHAASVLATSTLGVWQRANSMKLQLSGMTAGAAGFSATVDVKADGVIVYQGVLHLAATEYVDTNNLIDLSGMDIAAVAWTYDWTILAGAVTTDGVNSGNTNFYCDAAPPN